jgi:hypothetical protein
LAKQDDWVRITLRLPPELHDRVAKSAGPTSINAEIVHELERFTSYLDSVRWYKSENDRLTTEMRRWELIARAGVGENVEETLAAAIPDGLASRISLAAKRNGRAFLEEFVQALEAAFPPPPSFSLDKFNEEWLARIVAAPEEDRPDLVQQANAVLLERGGDFEVWLGKPEEGDKAGSVMFGRKIWRDVERAARQSGVKVTRE